MAYLGRRQHPGRIEFLAIVVPHDPSAAGDAERAFDLGPLDAPQPVAIARDDQILYIADDALPLIHVVDLSTPDGSQIPIEERNAKEVTHLGASRLTPEAARVRNPAFDVTPNKYVSAIVTEKGIARAPYAESLPALFER